MYYAYYNHKFIIQGSRFKVQGSGFGVRGSGIAMGAGRPLIPFENLV